MINLRRKRRSVYECIEIVYDLFINNPNLKFSVYKVSNLTNLCYNTTEKVLLLLSKMNVINFCSHDNKYFLLFLKDEILK